MNILEGGERKLEVDNIFRIFLSTVFISSGGVKLLYLDSFKNTINSLLDRWASFLSILVPIAELVVGVLILSNHFKKLGEIGLLILLIVFAIATSLALSKKKKISCGCFGDLVSESFGWNTVFKIIVLFFLDTYLILFSENKLEFEKIFSIYYLSTIFLSVGVITLYLLVVNLRSMKHNPSGG